MRTLNYINLFFLLLTLGFALLGSSAFAQNVSDYVAKKAPPNWVNIQKVPFEDTSLDVTKSTFYKLADWQRRISAKDDERYRHYAIELKTIDAVEENSNFTISFDPSYQRVDIHLLNIIRNGKRLNKLDLSQFDIYRKETDRQKLLYDGTLQIALIIPDVQIGDTLEYSYSVLGKNPALIPHYSTGSTLQYGVPIQHQHERILIHEDLPIFSKKYNQPKEPTTAKWKDYNSYTWLLLDNPKLEVEENIPDWYYARPRYSFSSYSDWTEVGNFFAEKYKLKDSSTETIREIANGIKKKTKDIKAQNRLALDYIHKNIRYTGIEIGSGGYEPRNPEKTVQQKFGDCKDMTVLLLAILRELGITAYPILVNTEMQQGVNESIPSHSAFDHVLVQSNINGTSYYLDGTRGIQLGDLDHIERGSYGKGLLLKPDASELIEIDKSGPAYYKDVIDTFDITSDDNIVTFESSTDYYGYEADNMESLFQNQGISKLETNFLTFFQNTYPTIEQVGEMSIERHEKLSKFSVRVNYKIIDAWQIDEASKLKTFPAYPSDVSDDVADFKGGTRSMPYAISHPRRSRHKLVFKADPSWDFEDSVFEENNDIFKFLSTAAFQESIYTETYIYETKRDYISADNFETIMTKLNLISDELGTELQQSTGFMRHWTEQNILIGFGLWIFIAGLISLIVVLIRSDVDASWQADQVFYPIKLSKFILLSLVSIGIYQYYWSYKNWKWLDKVGNSPNIPFLRALFMVFTNFSLLPKLANSTQKDYLWYSSFLGIILALLFLIMKLIGNIAEKIEEAPIWLSMVGVWSFLALIPSVLQISKLNEDNSEVIERNSAYHWTTFGFLILFAPVFVLVLIGLFMG